MSVPSSGFGAPSDGAPGREAQDFQIFLPQLLQLPENAVCPAITDARAAARDYWITSSARIRSDCGIVSPSAFAVFRLITNSNLVACSTGRSAGLAPLRILST